MGQATVGAMIVWDENLNILIKNLLDTITLNQKMNTQMREMLIRRVESFEKIQPQIYG